MRPPLFGEGQRIGLFGGSFNPAHRGHYMVALFALKRLKLDWVWWLVSPQNPLKDSKYTDQYSKRLAYTRHIAKHPRFIVTDLECQIDSHTTAETLDRLAPLLRRMKAVWIMGADSLANLHHWNDWTEIPQSLPLAVLARPGYSIRALSCCSAIRYASSRLPNEMSVLLPEICPPAWVFVHMPLRRESSTAIRKRRHD
jgi:nicotinate-nucleotide adenylyltransferase